MPRLAARLPLALASALLTIALLPGLATAQSEPGQDPLMPEHRGLRFYVGEDSTALFRPILVSQFWAKRTRNNPGTADVDGVTPADASTTFGLRRFRVLLLAELGDRLQAFTQFGINNQTFATGGGSGTGGVGGYGQAKKPQVFVHDAWAQLRALYRAPDAAGFPASIYLGAGLHYYNGLSRLTAAGVPTGMLLDFPIFNFPDVERGSQFNRQFGVYLKGDVRRLHYRLAVNQPFVNDGRGLTAPGRATDYPTRRLAYTAYAEWRFGEWEGHTLPFRPMTYVGGKRVFNVGAGFYVQPDAAADVSAGAGGELAYAPTAKRTWSVDAYAEQPLGPDRAAVTAYAVLYDYDFGEDYYRSFGLLNTGVAPLASAPPAADRSVDGFGNAEGLMGTGQIAHAQLGYLFGRSLLPRGMRFQTFGSVSYKDLDFLGTSTTRFDLGANLFLRGHSAKLSAQVGWRPVVAPGEGGGFEVLDRRAELVVQAQVAL